MAEQTYDNAYAPVDTPNKGPTDVYWGARPPDKLVESLTNIVDGYYNGQFFSQFNCIGIGCHQDAGMAERVELLLDGFYHVGMAVPRIDHGDATGKINIPFAFHIPDLGVERPLCKDWKNITHATWERIIFSLLPT